MRITRSGRRTWSSKVENQTRHPGIMQACRESRQMGGRFYEKFYEFAQQYSYAEDYPEDSSEGCEGNAIFINFCIDKFELRLLNPYRKLPLGGYSDSTLRNKRQAAFNRARWCQERYNFGTDILERVERINWVQLPWILANIYPKWLLRFPPAKEVGFERE
jgi:hypothetical protein